MKAKWAYAASILGAKFPPYVSRHFSSIQGESIAEFHLSTDSGTDSITFGGRGRGFGQTRDAVRDAGNIRAKQMATRVKHLLGLYRADVEQGRVPQPHAAATATGPMELAARTSFEVID